MLFFDYAFVFLFLPVTLGVQYLLPQRHKNRWLFAASLAFYSVSSWIFLPILLLSTLVDFVVGNAIARSDKAARRRGWLLVSLTTNLGALAYFKYAGFFTGVLHYELGLSQIPIIAVALPVGISFYTFQSMSYTIDIYRGQITPAARFSDFAAYVSLFPQLIAGPIVRYSDLAPQLAKHDHDISKFSRGLYLFIVGMAKKILIADTLAMLSRPLFAEQEPSFFVAWTAMLLFSGQIYFDFSGYSDMAIGLGKMLGFEFPQNFNSPYSATSFSDFWRRWHISLSSWLRDYLYVPLGGNRKGVVRTYINLMATMLLGGLWHGASWNFLLWGAAHGLLLAMERFARRLGVKAPPRLVRQILVFAVVTMVWVPFKFVTLAETQQWLMAMTGLGNGLGSVDPRQVGGLLALFCLLWGFKNTSEWKLDLDYGQATAGIALFLGALLVAYGRVEISPFLYFRF